jgi:hypothetical protein
MWWILIIKVNLVENRRIWVYLLKIMNKMRYNLMFYLLKKIVAQKFKIIKMNWYVTKIKMRNWDWKFLEIWIIQHLEDLFKNILIMKSYKTVKMTSKKRIQLKILKILFIISSLIKVRKSIHLKTIRKKKVI